MSRRVQIQEADDARDVIHDAVRLLAEGARVVMPTETVYVAAAQALQPAAVAELPGADRNGEWPPCSLAVKGEQEALDYVPGMSPLGRRLARRVWPGPVRLLFDLPETTGSAAALPKPTQGVITRGGRIALRAPTHQVIREILRLSPAPLVVSGESPNSGTPLVDPESAAAALGKGAALLIDDGQTRYGAPATSIHISGDQWTIVEPGVVSENVVKRLASKIVLFVCTGNTCRSPLAEGLFRKLLTERLKCTDDELLDRGYLVASAGVSAVPGHPASPESVQVAAKRGVDLHSHISQPLTDRLLAQSDRVFAMTQGHYDAIISIRPDVASRVTLLSREGIDVSDPIGCGMAEYVKCQEEIEQHLLSWLDEIVQA